MLLALSAAVMTPLFSVAYSDILTADVAFRRGHFPDAMKSYEAAARLSISNNDLWEQAGIAAYQAGDNSNAMRLLEVARQKGSLSAQGWDLLGNTYWGSENHTFAVSVWEAGLIAYPDNILLLDRLSAAYQDQGSYASEQALLIRRLELGQDAAANFRLGLITSLSNPTKAQGELNAASSLNTDYASASNTLIAALSIAGGEHDPSRRLVIIGRGLGLLEEWGLASKAFEQAVQADGRDAEAWAWLGEANQHIGLGGSSELDKALSLDIHSAVVHGLRGLFWKRQGKYTQALAEFRQAALVDPANPAWQIALGDAYTWTGDLVSALAAFQKATSLAPGDASDWRLLAMFCADHGVRVLDIGLPAAKMAAQLTPEDPQVLDALGWSYLNAGYLYNAEVNLLKAIHTAPDQPLPHIHLAEMYLRKGDNASAFDQLNRVRQLDENGPAGLLATQLLQQYFP